MTNNAFASWLEFHAEYQTLVNIIPNIHERIRKTFSPSENASIPLTYLIRQEGGVEWNFLLNVQKSQKLEKPSKIILNETANIQRIITDVYHDPKLWNILDPFAFERLVSELLRTHGFEIELTKHTRDGGYDIIALKYLDKHNPLKFLVECKRNAENRKVGVGVVRAFKEVVQSENVNRGLLVTTSYFTADAKQKMQQVPYLLDFKDKDDLITWVADYYRSFRNE